MARYASVAGLAAVLVVLLIVVSGYYTINEGERGVILRMGSVVGVAGPGFHLKVPITDSVVEMSVRTQKVTYDKMPSYSRDVQLAEIRVSVNYRAQADKVDEIYARFGTGYVNTVVEPFVQQQLKQVFGQYQAATVVADRTRLGREVEDAIRASVKGIAGDLVAIDSVQIENIDFSTAYEQAIEGAMQAEAEVRKSRNELERQKVEAEKVVVQAKAKAESTRQQAMADADAIRLKGEAEAAAVKAKGEALRDVPDLVTLIAAEKWNGVLPTTQVPGSSVPFIQIPQRAPSTGSTQRSTSSE